MAILKEDDYMNQKESRRYPFIKIREAYATTPLVIPMLDAGDIQLIITDKGKDYVLSDIVPTLKNVTMLFSTGHSLEFVTEQGMKVVEDVTSFMKEVYDYGLDNLFVN